MENSSISRVALRRATEGKHKSGRPREIRRRTVEKERIAMGYCSSRVFLGRGRGSAADRVSWRSKIYPQFGRPAMQGSDS